MALIKHINVSAMVAVILAGTVVICVSTGVEPTVTNNLISGLIGFIGGKVASK